LGVAVFTIAISALLALATRTKALAVFELMLGTMLPAVAVSVSVIFVPEGVPALTCNTRLKLAVLAEPVASVAIVQVIAPVPPTAGVAHDHPAGAEIDWKFVFGGVVCVKLTVVAAAGPLLVMLWA
jgi:hypothetical protein